MSKHVASRTRVSQSFRADEVHAILAALEALADDKPGLAVISLRKLGSATPIAKFRSMKKRLAALAQPPLPAVEPPEPA